MSASNRSVEVDVRSQPTRERLLVVALYLAMSVASMLGIAIARIRQPHGSRTFGMWDGAYYLRIAAVGYPSVLPTRGGALLSFRAAFFPVYPLVVRVVHAVTGLALVPTGVALNIACGLAATLLLRRLLDATLEPGDARRTTILFAVFPGAVVFSLVYAEGLMMLLIVACLLALVHERWLVAGLLGAAATGTRAIAIALVFAAAYAAWVAWRDHREARAFTAPLLVPFGYLAAIGYQWWLTGVPTTWMRVNDLGWGQHFDYGYRFVSPLLHPAELAHPKAILREGSLIAVFAAVWLLRKLRVAPILTWYTAGIAVQFLLSSMVGPRPRFLMTAFPLLIIPAHYFKNRTLVVLVAASLVATGVLAYAYATPGAFGGVP